MDRLGSVLIHHYSVYLSNSFPSERLLLSQVVVCGDGRELEYGGFRGLRIAQYIKIGQWRQTTIAHLLPLKMLGSNNSIKLPHREEHHEIHHQIHQAKTS